MVRLFSHSCSSWLATAVFLALPASTAAEEGETAAASNAQCGTVSVAELNWASAEILAHVDRLILENGYGCEVELVPGDTLSTLGTMIAEDWPDISPETWINSAREMLDRAVARRQLHYMAQVFADGGVEGWWIPHYVAEANPDIRTVADALARPDLFPAPDGTGGAIYNCPEGWSCEVTTRNLYRAYDAEEKGFELIESTSGDALEASLADAFAEQRGWLGYYWAPTPALGRFDMVKLNFDAAYDEELWNTCIIDPHCPAPQVTAWPRSEVYTMVTDAFLRQGGGGALGYLRQRSLDNPTLNRLLAWKAENEATAEQTALQFLSNGTDIWTRWVTDETAEAVIAALPRERFSSDPQ